MLCWQNIHQITCHRRQTQGMNSFPWHSLKWASFYFFCFLGMGQYPISWLSMIQKDYTINKELFIGLIFRWNFLSHSTTIFMWSIMASKSGAKCKCCQDTAMRWQIADHWDIAAWGNKSLNQHLKDQKSILVNSQSVWLSSKCSLFMSLSSMASCIYPCARSEEENHLLLWTV